MQYWLGAVTFASGALFFIGAYRHRRRSQELRARFGDKEPPPLHEAISVLAEVAPPMMVFFLFVMGGLLSIVFLILRANADIALSYLDLAGVWCLILGYARWVTWTARYRVIEMESEGEAAT